MITLLLCDDHAVVRKGLKVLLNDHPNIQVIGEASEGNEAIKKSLASKPDVVIMDLSMPGGLDGISATAEIKKQLPDTAILILTMHKDEEYLYRVMQQGASGIVLKSAPHRELIDAIHTVYKGDAYLYPAATKKLFCEYLEQMEAENNPLNKLTDREKEVLTLIAKGFSNKAIGEKLFISVKTVETHRGNLMGKLKMRTRPELVELALKKGLIGFGI